MRKTSLAINIIPFFTLKSTEPYYTLPLFLIPLFKSLGNGPTVRISYNCPFIQQIADMSETIIEANSRAINYLERSGFITFNGKDLYVFNKPVLKIKQLPKFQDASYFLS